MRYQIVYYLDYEGWCSYSDITFDTLEEADEKALELSKETNLEYAVIQCFSLFRKGKKKNFTFGVL